MKNNINIAEILKDCPRGMKLYSPLFGRVELLSVDDVCDFSITVRTVERKEKACFTKEGCYHSHYSDAECLLLPSSEMRDWTKFFKRGDVVWSKDNMYAIFEGWVNDDYTKFNSTICFYVFDASFDEEVVCDTDCFVKAKEGERAAFIANAEKHYNGKYNPDTLQVEPIKPTCLFKTFDKVLIRDSERQIWIANYFSLYNEEDKYYPYVCMGGSYRYCIPYKGNEHLLGTTDPYTEGGSE